MGMLIDGVWHEEDTRQREMAADGSFKRTESVFRNWVTADGSAGPSGTDGYKAEPDRYHLYVAHTCPWAHRALLFRTLKGLDGIVSVSYALPGRNPQGWTYGEDARYPDCLPDTVNGFRHLHEAYTATDRTYTGKVTVPTLWDKKRGRVVNNESSEIIRMFNSSFAAHTNDREDYYPADLRAGIDALNDEIYLAVNNGVYRCGFAATQEAYEAAFDRLFACLDGLEAILAKQRYLLGSRLTEADWRLFPTLIRFDVAYVGAFKCNLRRIVDYPNLWGYTRELYQMPGIAETFSVDYAKINYYGIEKINPTGIVPKGPAIDFMTPHGRERL